MHDSTRRRCRLLLAATAILLAVAAVAVGSAHGAASSGAVVQTDEDPTIEAEQVYEWDPHPNGSVLVELTIPADEVVDGVAFYPEYAAPDVEVTPVDSRAISTDGTSWTMHDEGVDARATYRIAVQNDTQGWIAGHETWARFEPPARTVAYGDEEYQMSYDRRVRSDGVARSNWVVLGELETVSVDTTNGGRITVVVPNAVERPNVSAVTDQLRFANERRNAGGVDQHVVGVVVPTISDAAGKAQDRRFITESVSAEAYDNTWMHEYFHNLDPIIGNTSTDHDQFSSGTMTWYTEAYAEYGADLATLQYGYGTFSSYRTDFVESRDYDETLVEQTDSTADINYEKGSIVVAAIDYQIRTASDGERSYDDVVAAIESRDHVTLTDYLSIVESVGNETIADRAERWINTTESPSFWSVSEHRETFGPVYRYETEPASTNRLADGRYRSVELSEDPALYPNQRVAINYTVTNVGGLEEPTEVQTRLVDSVSAEAVDEATDEVTVPAGESDRVTQSVTVPSPGDYVLNTEHDVAFLSVQSLDPVNGTVPADVDEDGRYEDFNRNGEVDFADVVEFDNHRNESSIQDHVPAYDYDGDGDVDRDDTDALFEDV